MANCWQIPLHKAKITGQCTMQWGVCTVLHPAVSRHFQTNYQMLCYHRMTCNLNGNTMFCLKVPFAKGCMMMQIFVTTFGWSQSFPMSCNGKAYEALGLLFSRKMSHGR